VSDDAEQEHVVFLASKISSVLAGEQVANACTALTLAVAVQIIATGEEGDGLEDYLDASRGFVASLQQFLRQKDVVDWLKANIVHLEPTRHDQ
jgi:hypothetical protein